MAIGSTLQRISIPRQAVAVPLIYLPALLLPFTLLSAILTYLHLRMLGARNLKALRDFTPTWRSHRYDLKRQIVPEKTLTLDFWTRSHLFWIGNCTLYCPLAVAILDWHTYLVHVVENFWCPFHHDRKDTYVDGAIDKSFWHVAPADRAKLHPDDCMNPIWNSDTELKDSPTQRSI